MIGGGEEMDGRGKAFLMVQSCGVWKEVGFYGASGDAAEDSTQFGPLSAEDPGSSARKGTNVSIQWVVSACFTLQVGRPSRKAIFGSQTA